MQPTEHKSKNAKCQSQIAEWQGASIQHSSFCIQHFLRRSRAAFTLVELLVTITIIGILAGMMFGGLQLARESAREQATKATIAKLHTIIMKRYESYMTRRVPLDLSKKADGTPLTLAEQAQDRLYAIRDLMRMEMPDRSSDINDVPITLPKSGKNIARPALSQLYYAKLNAPGCTVENDNGIKNGAAELLYLIVSMGSPEAMEQFNQSEIGDTNGNGWPEFLDGWGRPIWFLRWAPAYSTDATHRYSDIQFADPDKHHDPFDPRRVDSAAFQMFPLIYSSGTDKEPGLETKAFLSFTAMHGDIFGNNEFTTIGTPKDGHGIGLITNHHIEQR